MARNQIGDYFLMGRAQYHVALLAVLDLEHGFLQDGVTTRFFPDFPGLQGGHEDFQCPGPIHFLPHNPLDLTKGFQTGREKGIESAPEFHDEAGPHHEFVAGDFGILRRFAQGGYQSLSQTHKNHFLRCK